MNGSMPTLSMTACPCDHAFPETVCSYGLICHCFAYACALAVGTPPSVHLRSGVCKAACNFSSTCMTNCQMLSCLMLSCLMLSCLMLSCCCADASLKSDFVSFKLKIQTCAALTPLIKFCPVAVLWGYFAYMALDSLPGNQFWQRILLVGTDKSLYYK